MRFGPVPVADSLGKVLAHNISDDTGRRVLRKGRIIDEAVARDLARLGYDRVFVAELEDGDVPEDEAAERIADVVAGPGVVRSASHTGRVNLTASALGVVHVDVAALDRLNAVEGVTVATLPTNEVALAGQRVATVKVIPYALPAADLARVEGAPEAAGSSSRVLTVRAIPPTPVGVVLVGSRGAWPNLQDGLGRAVARRLDAFGCHVAFTECVALDEEALAATLAGTRDRGPVGMVVIGGETAIMDPEDLIPRGLRLAGGRVEHLGLPMDPGHLLLLGYLGDLPVVGAPGCVRGSVPDGFDAVVPRLLAGERLTVGDLGRLGHGGLLSDPRGRPENRHPRPERP